MLDDGAVGMVLFPGSGFSALTVLVGVQFLALSTQSFFVLNVALVIIWIAFAFVVIREHRRLSESSGYRQKNKLV